MLALPDDCAMADPGRVLEILDVSPVAIVARGVAPDAVCGARDDGQRFCRQQGPCAVPGSVSRPPGHPLDRHVGQAGVGQRPRDPRYAPRLGLDGRRCSTRHLPRPANENVSDHPVRLPFHADLTATEAEGVVDALLAALEPRGHHHAPAAIETDRG
jgi:hypothetical protein